MKKLTILFISFAVVSCIGEEEPVTTLSDTKIELNHDGKHQFVLKYGTMPIDNTRIIWKSRDEKVGTIDVSGTFHARKLGKSVVSAYTKDAIYQADVEVVTYDRSIQDPVLDFYATKAAIKAKEKRILHKESSETLQYSNGIKGLPCSLVYYFENGKMIKCIVTIPYSIFRNEVVTFLKERYPVMVKNGNTEVYYPDEQLFTASLTQTKDEDLTIIYSAK
ncbi:hypothetical protein [Emticicia fluvialis]|uniref:hypothetical protein n=1 Tax=Emticicia fluvialis TaxID=2974474 RepID=UPI00216522DD|nr:hypothetical protein [Emticicia fluvialis]